MRYDIDTVDAKEGTGGFVLIDEGEYDVEIVEKEDKLTANGDPMVNIRAHILNGSFKGKPLFDNIVIPRPGSSSFKIMGRTMHFLHVIGQPYTGKFKTDSDKWLYSKLRVKVKHKIQEKGKYAGQKVATVDSHDFFGGAPLPEDEPDPDVPFD